ncbi:S1 family peptidase [Actinosynnema sp. CA-299493]
MARAVAGDDDARFVLAFQTFLNQARNFADAEDPAHLAKSMLRRGAAEVRAAPSGRSREADGLYGDRTFRRNARAMVANRKRIIGGVRTSSFPDCVAVGSAHDWCCSGTIIAPNVVLTAAHCVGGGCAERVFLGEDVEFPDVGQVVAVRSAVVAPQYAPGSRIGDIAVLVLDRAVEVEPRKIARRGALDDATFVRVAGYGNTDFRGNRGYGIRRQVDVPLAGTSEGYGADLATEFVAGAPFLDLDSCSGDSGGPAYVSVDGEWLLAGATSRAISGRRVRPCGDGGVYTRVCEYEEWIRSVPGGKW